MLETVQGTKSIYIINVYSREDCSIVCGCIMGNLSLMCGKNELEFCDVYKHPLISSVLKRDFIFH